jgi:putative transposase
MKNAKFSEAHIMSILRQAENGVPVSDLCREHGMSSASFYKWRAKFGGMDASMMSEMKAMAEKNRRLKRMYAEMSMQNDLLKEALPNKSPGSRPFINWSKRSLSMLIGGSPHS